MSTRELRTCWQNCGGPDDPGLLADAELAAIDAAEDAIAPLEEATVEIRRLITLFEACYHEADKEAEFIIKAIGAGRCPPRSNERPAQRKRELENARTILSMWCDDPAARVDLDVAGVPGEAMAGCLGEPNPLKLWQAARVAERIGSALDPQRPWQNLALGVPADGGSDGRDAEHLAFLRQTRETMIHDTVDGRESKVSLAFAIDLLMPCSWDFVGCLVTILRAIGGDLHPARPLACCARNIRLSPLWDRLWAISNTLQAFWTEDAPTRNIDRRLLASLGPATPVKCWLAASLDKTIRLHLTQPFTMDLF